VAVTPPRRGPAVGDALLPVSLAAHLDVQEPDLRWLVRPLWGRAAVGVIGGQPKLGKSWLGLSLAVSVASATPCLDHFPVDNPGRALVYLAEDALPMVRARIEALCQHHRLDIAALDLHVITAPSLRLDLERDQERLAATVAALRPALLLLDPLIRIHRCEENSSTEISALLAYLRELQRTFDLAVALVHHVSKRSRDRPGQALRGSSDLHGWLDCGAYLSRDRDHHLQLTLEHRSAPAPEPIRLALVSRPDGAATHLEVLGAAPVPEATVSSLSDRVLASLRASQAPLPRSELRRHLKVQNQKLGTVLTALETAGAIRRTADGWQLASARPSGDLDLAAGPA
jgi:AAA domain